MYIFNFNTTLTQTYVPALIPCMVDTASLAGRLSHHALHALAPPSVAIHDRTPLLRSAVAVHYCTP